MSIFTDLKNVSDGVIDQLAERFDGLPRPLLAAIGAGDLAIEQLAKVREQVSDKLGVGSGMPDADDVKSFATDLPGRAQQVAGDVARHVEEFAQAAPEKVQRLIGELPGKASELGQQLSPDNLRSTVDAYTQVVGNIYGTLADRGDEAVTKVRAAREKSHGEAGSEAAAATGAGTKQSGGEATAKQTGSKPRSARSSATEPGAKSGAKSGATKSGATKPSAADARKSGATKQSAPKRTGSKPRATEPGTTKPRSTRSAAARTPRTPQN